MKEWRWTVTGSGKRTIQPTDDADIAIGDEPGQKLGKRVRFSEENLRQLAELSKQDGDNRET